MGKLITVNIDKKEYKTKPGKTILETCQENKIHIPTLCNHPDLNNKGLCRMCVVEVAGNKTLQAACTTPIVENMEIYTASKPVRQARKAILELLLANHYTDCTTCARDLNCELQDLASEYMMTDLKWQQKRTKTIPEDFSSVSFIRDNNKCVLCQRCIKACEELQGVGAIYNLFKGSKTIVGSAFNKPISEIVCINCGQCVAHCPTGALYEKTDIDYVWEALENPTKTVIIQTAPSIRAALGEEFELPPGTRVTGEMIAALKKMGFDYVFDTQFTSDLTIMEEATELLDRLKRKIVDNENVALPMATSCSPGWIKFCEYFFPDLTENLSTCKSPQQMFGALLKTYWAESKKMLPKDIISVSVMPCVAKKFEAERPEMKTNNLRDVDYVLTTRELAKMIKQANIDLKHIEKSEFDDPLGKSSGAATIFAVTGGVMEAALRTAHYIITGREIPFENLNVIPVRGLENIKETSITLKKTKKEWNFLEGITLNVAVIHGTANAKEIFKLIQENKSKYHFIEVMACPGGCIGGGGQPIPTTPQIRKERIKAIYIEDTSMAIRESHKNKDVTTLYKDFLDHPGSHISHKLLHTTYVKRGRY